MPSKDHTQGETMSEYDDNPTWQAIPLEYRSVWYRVPGFSAALGHRGATSVSGTGISASTTIEGIRTEGDIARAGEIIPFRWFDEAVRQGNHLIFFMPRPSGYGILPVEPDADEMQGLYERFPAMRPAAKPKRKPIKAQPIDNDTEENDA